MLEQADLAVPVAVFPAQHGLGADSRWLPDELREFSGAELPVLVEVQLVEQRRIPRLGFGQGWACARDHLPTIADQIVKVRSERARFHGPGPAESHLASDLGYLALGVVERAAWLRDQQPAWIRELVSGYTAGYNRRVAEVTAEGSLPEWCAGAEWIRPIDELDLYAYLGVGLALPHQLWTGADFLASTASTVYWWTLYAVAAGAVLT